MKKKAFVTPHFHYDTEWVMTETEYAEVIGHHIKQVLDIMEKDPEFKFVLDQQVLLEHIRAQHPSLWEELKKRVREGRIDLVCGMYVMPDSNLPCIESNIRQILIGKRFMRKEFGVDPVVGWMLDPFGNHAQTPQVWLKSGFKYFAFKRGYGGKLLSDFIWKGLDGSKILTHFFIFGYGNAGILPEDIDEGVLTIKSLIDRELKYSNVPIAWLMNGNDFSPPNPSITEIVKRANKELDDVDVHVATPTEIFKEIEKYSDTLPIVEGEMQYGQYEKILPGCYSSRIWVKQLTRELEFLLSDAERMATIAWSLGMEYPFEKLDKAWKNLLHNAFHDVICGCGIDEIYDDAYERFIEAEKLATEVLESAITFIASKLKVKKENDSIPFFIVNTQNWERTDVAVININVSKLRTKGLALVDEDGNEIPYEAELVDVDENGNLTNVSLVFVAENVPPLGIKLYYVKKADELKVSDELPEPEIENEYYKITVDAETGLIDEIYDKEAGRSILAGPGNELEITPDAGDLYYSIEPPEGQTLLQSGSMWVQKVFGEEVLLRDIMNVFTAAEKSDVKSAIYVEGYFKWRDEDLIRWRSTITLYKKVKRIDFDMEIDFNNPHSAVKVNFPVDIESETFFSEIPGGVTERPKIPKFDDTWREKPTGTWPVQNWLDYTDGSYGVTLINLGLPEHKIDGNTLKLTLLRSVDLVSWGDAGPKLYAPKALLIGEHVFKYALYPHSGTWKDAKSYKVAYSYNVPFIAVEFDEYPVESTLDSNFSFMKITPENLVVTAIKKAEDDDSVIIRFFETEGKDTEATIRFYKPVKQAHLTNLLEEESSTIEIKNNEILLSVKPFEIVTVKISFT
ncbi:MAG: alpha-mannosidase [Candidatus Asgardarchaeia archaeon]